MKRILFVIGQLRVGGVSKALIELLQCIDGMYDISLLCFDQGGAFLADVPKSVRVLPTSNLLALTERSAKDMRSAGRRYTFLRTVFSAVAKLTGKKWPAKLLVKMVKKIPDKYDVAISFAHPMPDRLFCNLGTEIVLNCVEASKKVSFIHCDFAAYGGDSAYNRSLLAQFDKVAVVSDSVGRRLGECVPQIAHKICTVQNCHNFEEIRKMADMDPVTYSSDITFVTVARLSKEKGLCRCVPVFAKLCREGYNVQWHIVGEGPMRGELEETITAHGAEKCIVLEGEQINAYRFMKNANFLLVPSYHEAAPMVFDEAAALGVEVISTRTLSAEELVASRGLGVVCDNTDDGLTRAINQAVICRQRSCQQTIASVSNEDAIKSFIKLCEAE